MIKVAILSFWHLHGSDYARAAEAHPDTIIAAVWDADPERGRREAQRWGATWYESLDELLAQPDIDGVVVTTPTSAHRDTILAALAAGKHVFTEKVIAATLQVTEEIVEAAEAAGVAFVVSMWRSDMPYAHAVSSVLDSGLLGTLTQVRVRDGHPMALPTAEEPRGRLPEHFYDPVEAQGGILIDLCHPVYLLNSFLGLPESVSATFGFATGRPVEDNAVVTYRYANGAIGVAETSSVSAFTPFSIEAHGTAGSLYFSAEGIGELVARKGKAAETAALTEQPSGPDGVLRVRSARAESDRWEEVEIPGDLLPTAFEQWISHIQARTTAPQNVALGVGLSAVIEAAYLSAESGSSIDLDTLARHRPLPVE